MSNNYQRLDNVTLYQFTDPSCEKSLFVSEKNTHGTIRFYPDCDLSNFLCVMKRKTSFTEEDLKELIKYGFVFQIKAKDISFNKDGIIFS